MSALPPNGVPLALAPLNQRQSAEPQRRHYRFDVTCHTGLQPQQTALVRCLFGDSEVQPASITKPANPQFADDTALHHSRRCRWQLPGASARRRIDSLPVLSGSPATFRVRSAAEGDRGHDGPAPDAGARTGAYRVSRSSPYRRPVTQAGRRMSTDTWFDDNNRYLAVSLHGCG